MENIKISVSNKIPALEGTPSIVCGNSGYTITFAFDEEWAELPVKTARFVYSSGGVMKHQDAAFEGDTVAVPVLSNIREVWVGVFAGDLTTTTRVRIPCKPSILCGSGEVDPGGAIAGGMVFVQPDEPKNAVDGSLWVDTDAEIPAPGGYVTKEAMEAYVAEQLAAIADAEEGAY